jgi:hypothetical protein
MSFASIKLPVPINVEHRKPGSRSSTTKKTYNEVDFEVPSLSLEEVSLVAQWSQPWGDAKQVTSSETNLIGGGWQRKLAQAEHMVALIEFEGVFYVPVRGREHDGAVQYLVTAENACSMLAAGMKTLSPFKALGTLDLHPQHMGFNFRNHGVGGERPFAETGLPEGQVLIGTNEAERVEQMGGYMAKNFVVIDGVLFSSVPEPMILVKTGAETVSMRMVTKHEEGIVQLLEHYFRLDDFDRALQMVDDHYLKERITAQFSDLSVVDSEPLSTDFESSEAVRMARCLLNRVGAVLSQVDGATAEPWYPLKKLLSKSSHEEGEIDEIMSLVEKMTNALEANEEVDEEWRMKTAQYGRLGAERWMYRPITFSGPRI